MSRKFVASAEFLCLHRHHFGVLFAHEIVFTLTSRFFFWHLSHPPAFYFMLKLPRTFRTRKANFPCQYFNKSEVNHKHRMTASYKNVEHFDKERICFRSSSIQNCKWWENSITRTSQTLEGLFFVREKTNLKLTLRSVLRSVVDFLIKSWSSLGKHFVAVVLSRD